VHAVRVLRSHRRGSGLVLTTVLALAGLAQSAQAQSGTAATVSRVISGDTVEARLPDGNTTTVRLIGVDAPEPGAPGVPVECGASEAAVALSDLVLGQQVVLTGDPGQPASDRFGRALFYVDRADGIDVGLVMIRRGWATIYTDEGTFARLPQYESAENDATGGVWAKCDGEFHRSAAAVRREAAVAFVELYYDRISARRFLSAWGMLGERRKRQVRPFRQWRAGFAGSLGVSVISSKPSLRGRRAVVRVRLRSRDRDVCSHSVVRQYFRGKVTLASRGDSWRIIGFDIRKTRGKTPRTSRSQCPAPKRRAPGPAPGPNCQGYSPCLTPGPDYDCAGGSGDGPRYVQGPVYVNGSDPYDLDRDGDGVACES
jgi:endonuclease YncB( thermonuclease family)